MSIYRAELYKVGDKVVVKSKEELVKTKGELFENKVVTISEVRLNHNSPYGDYKIKEENDWCWYDKDFVGLYEDTKTPYEVEVFKPNEFTVSMEREIVKIIYNDPATIVFYKDHMGNTKRVVSVCDENDTYDKATGLDICMLKAFQREVNKQLKQFIK